MDSKSALTDAIIKSKISLIKQKDEDLSFIAIKFEDIDSKSLELVLLSICKLLDKNSIVEFDSDIFLILMEDNLSIANILVDRLSKIIFKIRDENEFTFKYYFAVTDLHKKDDIDSILDRLELFLERASVSKNFKISDNDKDEDFLKNQVKILDIFRIIKKKNETIRVSNFYKGIVLRHDVKLKNIYSHSQGVDVELTSSHAIVIDMEKETFIEHLDLPAILKADLVGVNWANKQSIIVRLNSFRMLEQSPIQRKYLRVEPEGELFVDIEFLNRAQRGRLINISLDSFAVRFDALEPKLTNSLEEIEVVVHFPSREFKTVCKPIVINEKRKKVVFVFLDQKISEEYVLKYIASRELELIRDLKSKIASYLKYKNLK